jgi:hypothetical protein
MWLDLVKAKQSGAKYGRDRGYVQGLIRGAPELDRPVFIPNNGASAIQGAKSGFAGLPDRNEEC